LIATAVLAQLLPAYAEEAAKIETVVVTGSLLKRTDANSPNPVTFVTAEEIRRSGAISVEGLLAKVASATNQGQNAGSVLGGQDGASFGDLRNLGSNRTLVLLNGRRMVSTFGSGAIGVDLNNVPVALIERIEVLRDGASPIYGSDAVGGVINIITKERFKGARLDAEAGQSSEGDARTRRVAGLWGANFGEGNLLISADFQRRSGVALGDRKFALNFVQPYPIPTYGPDGKIVQTVGSSVGKGGLAINGAGEYFTVFGPGPKGFKPFEESDRVDAPPSYGLIPQQRRFNLSVHGNYAITEAIEAFFESTYTTRAADIDLTPARSAFGVPASNPSNPFGEDVFLVRRFGELGDSIIHSPSKLGQVVAGLRGDLNDKVSWQFSAQSGRSRSEQQISNQVNTTRLQDSLDPATCASVPGCVVSSVFGFGSITQPMADYLRENNRVRYGYSLTSVNANVTADVYALPAGMLTGLVGVESRRESGFSIPDESIIAGTSSYVQSQITRGTIRTDGLFFEAGVPLLKNQALAKALNASIAARLTHQDPFGSNRSWKLGLDWAIDSNVRVRTNLSTAFRAPNINELFGGVSQSFTPLGDPCDASAPQRQNASVDAACLQAGLAKDFSSAGQNASLLLGGNPAAKPETAREKTLGFVLTPKFLPGFSASVDAYSVNLRSALGPIDAQYVLDRCYASVASLSGPFCAYVKRLPNGQINTVSALTQNLGAVRTSGVDLGIQYDIRLKDWGWAESGKVTVASQTSYLSKYDVQNLPESEFTHFAGTEGPRNFISGAYPRFKSTSSLTYSANDWSVGTTARMIGGSSRIGADPVHEPYTKVPNTWYYDLVATFRLGGFDVAVGAENLTNKAPPFMANGYNYDPQTYDAIGRYGYVKVSTKF
jgi:outer membrane receptor protein involved in Fe transport